MKVGGYNRCGQSTGEGKILSNSWIHYDCPDINLKARYAAIHVESKGNFSILEVHIAQCPNGFKYEFNRCLKVLQPSPYGIQLRTCQVMNGYLLDTENQGLKTVESMKDKHAIDTMFLGLL